MLKWFFAPPILYLGMSQHPVRQPGLGCIPRLMAMILQISEAELEAIAREGGDIADQDMIGAGGETTRRLLGDYATPAR